MNTERYEKVKSGQMKFLFLKAHLFHFSQGVYALRHSV